MSCEVTVVVPTVDRVELLERCLRGLAAQHGVDYEVCVVHDGNPAVVGLLAEWADRIPTLRPLRAAERGASVKRNLGWRSSAARLVAFTDDDCEPSPGWLAAVTASFAGHAAADIVQGPVRPHPDDAAVTGPFARTIEVTGATETYPTANLSLRRDALARVGGFDERLRAGEDTDLAWRVRETGGDATYAPAALVLHAVRRVGFRAHLRSLRRWGDLPLVVRRHPQLRRLTHTPYVWKDMHTTALPALAGLLVAPVRPAAVVAALPHAARRVRRDGVRAGLLLAATDVVEVAVLCAGSVRHRCVLL